MKEQIIKLMQLKQLSSQKFAEVLDVQPSGISHILSGRNKPSFDFIQKVLLKYPELNAEWLITGNGDMFKSTSQASLFEIPDNKQNSTEEVTDTESTQISNSFKHEELEAKTEQIQTNNKDELVEKIVVFYLNGTFKEYRPKDN